MGIALSTLKDTRLLGKEVRNIINKCRLLGNTDITSRVEILNDSGDSLYDFCEALELDIKIEDAKLEGFTLWIDSSNDKYDVFRLQDVMLANILEIENCDVLTLFINVKSCGGRSITVDVGGQSRSPFVIEQITILRHNSDEAFNIDIKYCVDLEVSLVSFDDSNDTVKYKDNINVNIINTRDAVSDVWVAPYRFDTREFVSDSESIAHINRLGLKGYVVNDLKIQINDIPEPYYTELLKTGVKMLSTTQSGTFDPSKIKGYAKHILHIQNSSYMLVADRFDDYGDDTCYVGIKGVCIMRYTAGMDFEEVKHIFQSQWFREAYAKAANESLNSEELTQVPAVKYIEALQ